MFRMMRFFYSFVLLIGCCILMHIPSYAGTIDISAAQLETTEEGYRLVTHFQFELSHELQTVVNNGIPLYFTTEVHITRARWYWFDENTVSATHTVRIAYNLMTRQYRVSINNGFAQNYATLQEALALVRHPSRWLVASKQALQPEVVYHVSLRCRLDTDQLPKLLQFNVINNSDWRLASDWKRFTFTR